MRFTFLILAAAQVWAQPGGGFKSEFLREFNNYGRQAIALAEAMPADKYAWRPGAGVRSVSEVYVHIAAGNWLLLDTTGVPPPTELYPRLTGDRSRAIIARNTELEKTVADQPHVVEALKRSLAAVRESLEKTTEAGLERPVKFFGREESVRSVYLRILVHLSEHLGQSVAYARMHGVVPPWSRAQ